jgi:predicted amidohydrolase
MLSYGNSLAADPWGSIVARAKEKTGVTLVEIDLEYLEEVQGKMQTLKNRRTDVYRLEEKSWN